MPAVRKRRHKRQRMQLRVRLKCRRCRLGQHDGWWNEVGAGDQIFLAKRAMGRIVRCRQLAVPAIRDNGISRELSRYMYVRLGEVSGLREGNERERKHHPAPESTESAYV